MELKLIEGGRELTFTII